MLAVAVATCASTRCRVAETTISTHTKHRRPAAPATELVGSPSSTTAVPGDDSCAVAGAVQGRAEPEPSQKMLAALAVVVLVVVLVVLVAVVVLVVVNVVKVVLDEEVGMAKAVVMEAMVVVVVMVVEVEVVVEVVVAPAAESVETADQ